MKTLTIKNSASVAVLLATFALHGCGGSSSSDDTAPVDPVDPTVDNAAVRISDDVTFSTAQIETAGAGMSIVNNVDSTAIYYDAETEAYFDTLANVTTDGTELNVPEYDYSWVPAPTGYSYTTTDTTTLTGDIDADLALTAGVAYGITGAVNVLEGASLTIPAGTILYGTTGSSYLAINRGAQIFANGTAADPIVFTSADDFAGNNVGNEQGQWGGLSIMGQSTNNKGERTYEAGTQLYGPANGVTVEADNSGELSYVAIKYSGFEVEVDKELNGLSLASVGSGTTINNIAIIGSADDAIEFWGGTVSVDGLYLYNAGDDTIDTDQGYTGTISNVFAEQNVVADPIGSRCIEADGFDATQAGTPVSKPVLENAILNCVGRAIRLREGTGYVFDNVQVNVVE